MGDFIGDNKWIPKGGDNADSTKMIWSTKMVNDLVVALDKGYKPRVSMPFYEGRQHMRKGNIVFDYTDWEIQELAKCANDIVYFAEKYAVVMTDDGVQQVEMRDYQKELLKSFQHNRWNIVLAARQMGKCPLYDTKIDVRDMSGTIRRTSIGNLYYQTLRKQRPLKMAEWIKWSLWKLYDYIGD